MSAPADLDALAGRVGGRLDGVLHAIGFAPESCLGGGFLTAPWEDVAVALQISAYSLKALAVACRPLMAGGGSIVGLDFDNSRVAWPVYDWMGVAKAALESTARYLARDLGAEGIRVNLVAAGPIRTIAARSIPGFEQFEDAWSTRAPLGWDVKDAVAGRERVRRAALRPLPGDHRRGRPRRRRLPRHRRLTSRLGRGLRPQRPDEQQHRADQRDATGDQGDHGGDDRMADHVLACVMDPARNRVADRAEQRHRRQARGRGDDPARRVVERLRCIERAPQGRVRVDDETDRRQRETARTTQQQISAVRREPGRDRRSRGQPPRAARRRRPGYWRAPTGCQGACRSRANDVRLPRLKSKSAETLPGVDHMSHATSEPMAPTQQHPDPELHRSRPRDLLRLAGIRRHELRGGHVGPKRALSTSGGRTRARGPSSSSPGRRRSVRACRRRAAPTTLIVASMWCTAPPPTASTPGGAGRRDRNGNALRLDAPRARCECPPTPASQSSVWVIAVLGLKNFLANDGMSACTVRVVTMR